MSFYLFLGAFRSDHHHHARPLQLRHHLHLAKLLQLLREPEQHDLALVLIDDGTTSEQHLDPHLVAILKEPLGMIELELKVMVVGLGTETDFLDDGLAGIRLDFLLLLLLVENELLVVHSLADWGIGVGRDLHQVQPHVLGDAKRLLDGIDIGIDTFTNQSHHRSLDFLIDPMLVIAFLLVVARRIVSFVRELCYFINLLSFVKHLINYIGIRLI